MERQFGELMFGYLFWVYMPLLLFTCIFLSFPGFMLLAGRTRKEWEVDVIYGCLEKYLKTLCSCPIFTDCLNVY